MKKQGGFEVVGHTWKREIAIERFGAVSDSAWCDGMPADARGVHRTREVRSHERVPDGEDCHTRKVDNGNGTFVEKRECSPKYRDEPVYSERCQFTVDRWKPSRSATQQGSSVAEAPTWPNPGISRTGSCQGCEREGGRSETYTVVFRDAKGASEHTCDFDQQKWASFADGSSWKGEVHLLGNALVCDSLRQ
jgi:hypothetical protein